jgi:thiol-disulfide isomerase/thioredoxin
MKPAMPKKIILLVLLLAIGALVLVGVLQRKSRSKVNSAATLVSAGTSSHISGSSANLPVIRFVKNPESAPPLQAQDLLGKPITKENWGGKVVLVNFWATWCPPCREEIPELLELEKEYKGQLQIVGISEDDDPPEKVMKFAQKQGMTYPIVMATQEMIDAYGGVPALPTSFLIDTQGRVVQKHSGLYPIESYRQEIRSLLGLATDVRVETFVDTGQVFLKNASNATELPGVDFAGLSPEQKKLALHRMNAESCTCGCKLTVSQCRVNDGECPTSRDLAAQIVREASGGGKAPQPLPTAGNKSITQ